MLKKQADTTPDNEEQPETGKHAGLVGSFEELRHEAEDKLADRSEIKDNSEYSDIEKLLHELQVQKIELEMQNQALQQAQTLLESSRDNYRDRYQNLYDFAPVGYLTLNAENLIAEINLTAAAMLGVERNNLILQPFPRWIAEDNRSIWRQSFLQLKQPGDKQQCELLMQRGDTSTFYAQLNCDYVLGDQQAASARITLIDISERRLQRQQIEKSLSLLSATLESSNDAILVVDPGRAWVMHNQRFLELWQIPPEIIAANDDEKALDYVLEQLADPDGFLQQVQALYATPQASSFDKIKFKDGKVIERYSIPQRIDGEVVGRVWSFRDVTAAERAALALKREAEKNLALLRNASDGIHILDSQGYILEVSDSFCAMLGYQRSEMAGMCASDWDGLLSGDEIGQVINERLSNRGHAQFQTLHRRKDGSIFDVEISSFPFELEGKPVLYCASRDISERKQSERLLLESQRRYAGIVESAMDGIITIDADQRILLFNAAAEKMFACSADEAVGSYLQRFIPERFHQAHNGYCSAFGETNGAGRKMGGMDYVMALRANGGEFPIEASISMVDAGGEKSFTAIIRDITERMQFEERLQSSQKENQFLADLIRDSAQPIGTGYVDGRMGLFNTAYMELIGYTAVELQGLDWARDLTPPEWFDLEQAKLAELNSLCTSVRYEKEYIRKDGSRVPIELLVNLKTDTEGKLEFYYAFITDITERKQAVQVIRDNEQRMLLATEATGVGIWEWNMKTGKIRWDAQMFRIYGIQPTADGFVDYAAWSGLVLPADLPGQEQIMRDTISRLGRSVREFRVRRAGDGKCRYIQAVETVRTNDQGQAEWLVGTNLDVTERTLAETALRESEERWRFALDVTKMGAWELNLTDGSAWRSLRHDQIFGYETLLPEWTLQMALQHTLEEDRPLMEGSFLRAMANRQDWSFVCRIRRAGDGAVRWIWAHGKSLDEAGGQPRRMFGVVADITERKETEQALRDTARRKDEFLAMLAHELRNPLAPIRNAVQILKHANVDLTRITWCSDVIDRQVEHMIRLVDDLLDISRISRGQIELKKETLEIRDFIRPAVETIQPMLDSRRHKFSLTIPPEPLWIEGDRIRLAQVVSNLINNAAKYTEEGGSIGLSVEQTADAVCLRVSDNGCGIDQTDLGNLFELFYQAESNLDRSQGGLGIGLSLVQSLVEKHGGSVKAFSAGLGLGSEFVVCLPRLALVEPNLTSGAASSLTVRRQLLILVVDDNRDITESLAFLLGIDGHRMLTANNGPAALEIAAAERPDVIMLDIGLPKMNGYRVAEELRQNRELANTLLIALTGYGQPEDKKKSLAAGFDEHMVKPPNIQVLRKLLADYQAKIYPEAP